MRRRNIVLKIISVTPNIGWSVNQSSRTLYEYNTAIDGIPNMDTSKWGYANFNIHERSNRLT